MDLFGTEVRILVGAPTPRRAPGNQVAAVAVEQLLRRHHALLTRFDPDSELSRLNADPREEVPISEVLAGGLRAALHGAELTDGLVDGLHLFVYPTTRSIPASSKSWSVPATSALAWASSPPN